MVGKRFKGFGKVRTVGEVQFKSNFSNGFVGKSQQPLGFENTSGSDDVRCCVVGDCFANQVEVMLGNMQLLGIIICGFVFPKVIF